MSGDHTMYASGSGDGQRSGWRKRTVYELIEANGLDLHGDIEHFAELVRADEREACAKVCEDEADDGTEGEWDGCCLGLARAIRARGQA
jgi:hypothetical protein